jgi:uncharacterized protein YdbL (DUF1318 family)
MNRKTISVARQLWTALWVLIYAVLPLSSQVALAQFMQQGPKLVGTGAVGQSLQGFSVAMSADGSTAILGGIEDNSNTGAVWVYARRSQDLWTQDGSKLVGTGAVGDAQQGYSVALSSDGNTAIVGARADNSNAGAVWVYTRSSEGLWTQQGSKLVHPSGIEGLIFGSWATLSGERLSCVGPAERPGHGGVEISDELLDPGLQHLLAGEVAAADELSHQNGKPDFDLIEP